MIKVNITNTYRFDVPPNRESEKRSANADWGTGKVGAMVDRKMASIEEAEKVAKLQYQADSRSEESDQQRTMTTTMPADINEFKSAFEIVDANARRLLAHSTSRRGDIESAAADLNAHPELVNLSEEQEAVEGERIHDADVRQQARKRLYAAKEEPSDWQLPEEKNQVDLWGQQRASRSVLEEYLDKMLKQSREKQADGIAQADATIAARSAAEQETTEVQDERHSENQESALQNIDFLQQREQKRDARDDAMYAVHKRVHQAYLEQLDERVSGTQKFISAIEQTQQRQNNLLAQAATSAPAVDPFFDEPIKPEPLVLPEDYARQLALALEATNASADSAVAPTPAQPVTPIATLQKEGVFGLSTGGRNLSLTDFIKQKEFEYNLDQVPFTLDAFLQETENAIFETLNNGNSRSVTGTLLRAAEAVNNFRNHIIRAAESPEAAASAPAPADNSTGHPWQDDERKES